MASLKERITTRVAKVRARRPSVDHVVRMQEHYSGTGASQQAGAVTYFGFLSFFPILALSFFTVGLIAHVYPGARHDLRQAIDSILPGLVGSGHGQISMRRIESVAGAVGLVGLVGVLYAGLGWVSSLRSALVTVFCVPRRERPGFLTGKLRDLLTLAVLGVVLLVAVAVTGFVRGFSGAVLDWIGVSHQLGWLVWLVTLVLGLAANALLFYAMFVLLAEPRLGQRSLWAGAVLGGVGFEVLKQLSGLLLAATKGQPAFQAFGISLILLVWINYFSRVTLYAAAYAVTAEPTRPSELETAPVQGPRVPALEVVPRPRTPAAAFAAGAATMAVLGGLLGALLGVLRRKK
jgi:membrane protein